MVILKGLFLGGFILIVRAYNIDDHTTIGDVKLLGDSAHRLISDLKNSLNVNEINTSGIELAIPTAEDSKILNEAVPGNFKDMNFLEEEISKQDSGDDYSDSHESEHGEISIEPYNFLESNENDNESEIESTFAGYSDDFDEEPHLDAEVIDPYSGFAANSFIDYSKIQNIQKHGNIIPHHNTRNSKTHTGENLSRSKIFNFSESKALVADQTETENEMLLQAGITGIFEPENGSAGSNRTNNSDAEESNRNSRESASEKTPKPVNAAEPDHLSNETSELSRKDSLFGEDSDYADVNMPLQDTDDLAEESTDKSDTTDDITTAKELAADLINNKVAIKTTEPPDAESRHMWQDIHRTEIFRKNEEKSKPSSSTSARGAGVLTAITSLVWIYLLQ